MTKECDYGLRVLRKLSDGKKQGVKEICHAEHVPEQYAYKILKKLERAGFVQSLRGRDGGYQLIKPLDSFSIYDVVSAIDENLLLSECLQADDDCPHNSDQDRPCTIHCELERIQNILVDEMRRKTMNNFLV
ncbi:MAG: Rrf2 family transcriptional regulator [Oscillospiraceae bacterium]|nr:Rrf2 family transcriptional regulator [Oscillospiraceae bacterium]